MIEAYRICKEPNPAKAFSGQGSIDWGGRWNSKGVAVVYTAQHRSLATLEILIHLKGGSGTRRGAVIAPFYTFGISFGADLLEELPFSSLPAGWNAEPSTGASQGLGDEWVTAARTPVLSLPSMISPKERSFILNPNHSRFSEIRIGAPVACSFDLRLL